ncbi:MAG: hypothetical protein COB73_01850 [Flavobacteriaceae bacterium]|nr:MAG: hypothetical protein COB73_01850 [Flavobacteriaceae bacterium]
MRNLFLFFFLSFFTLLSFGQTLKRIDAPKGGGITKEQKQQQKNDSTFFGNDREITVELDGKTHYKDYKIITFSRDTLIIDTTLTMKKDYKFNYLRKDVFELMPFQNQGQTYNRLGYDFTDASFIPKMGMSAKHYNFKEIEDIKYYQVPTPTSELMWRSGMQQGQAVDAFVTMNKSPQFNFSFAFNGLRSLGRYRESLSSHGNFRMTMSYNTKNERYYIRGHLASHKIKNEENGGLTPQSIELFESGDGDYTDRGRLDVNFSDAENILRGKRYHIEHDYKFFKVKDSVSEPTNLKIGHVFSYETKHYEYTQTANALLGDAYDTQINDDTGLRTMSNTVFLDIDSPFVLGNLRAKTNYYSYNHYFNGQVNLTNETIDPLIKGNALSLGADWNAKVKNFSLSADVSTIVTGTIKGNSLVAAATYQTDSVFSVTAKLTNISKMPDFNYIHFQSDYVDYNWQNTDFNNEKISSLGLEFKSDKWVDASASITRIENYTYFDSISKPQQANKTVSYLKVKVHKALTFKKFTLDNTMMYQNIASGADYLRVPEFVTRNTLYYRNHLFKNKPLLLETGITFKYFSEYKMNAYDPLLSEFYLQDANYGGFPMFDFFVNAQVRRTRFFFKLENITSSFTGRNYYSAPLNPYRDFTVRFGLVWNFFI